MTWQIWLNVFDGLKYFSGLLLARAPISEYPSRDQVEREYEEEPLSYEEVITAEEASRQELKSRPRRHSSGDKRAERRPETRRLDSTNSLTSESDNDSESGDKLQRRPVFIRGT